MATDQVSELPGVEYRECPDWPAYRIGSDGTIWSRWKRCGRKGGGTRFMLGTDWRKLRPRPNKNGYPLVVLRHHGRILTTVLHRLVLLAFVGPCPPGLEGCHNDGNPANNTIGNLRWDTRRANQADKIKHGRYVNHGQTARGERNGMAKLDAMTIQAIRSRYAAGDIAQWQLAADYGVSQLLVSKIVRRLMWAHVP